MHANVPVRFGRGRLDSLGNKGLAAYLIAVGFGLGAHVDGTEARKSHADRVKWDRSWDNVVLLFTRQSPSREGTVNVAQDGANG
jgi:hypothetical protein